MARIGEFGAAKRELSGEKDDFVFCGEEFLVQRPMPAVLALQLGASISGKIDETEGFAAMWEALRVSLTIPGFHRLAATDEYDDATEPDEFGTRFIWVPDNDDPFKKLYALAVENDVELDQMMRLVMGLFEAQTGRPTKRASVSSDGRPRTSPSSSTSSHLRSVESLIQDDEFKVDSSPDIELGDGQIVQLIPAERTG